MNYYMCSNTAIDVIGDHPYIPVFDYGINITYRLPNLIYGRGQGVLIQDPCSELLMILQLRCELCILINPTSFSVYLCKKMGLCE